ncbi:MAG TPA: TIGR03067 domain-containing protein [Humisphaera sp.]
MQIRTIAAVVVAVLGLVAAPAAWAADAPADATKAELAKLAGTWQAVAGSRGGQAATAEELKATQIVFDGEKMRLKDGKRDLEAVVKRLDPSKTPAEFDFIPSKDGKAEEGAPTILAVYKLDGETLTIAFGKNPAARPKNLDAGETTKVLTLKKEKK